MSPTSSKIVRLTVVVAAICTGCAIAAADRGAVESQRARSPQTPASDTTAEADGAITGVRAMTDVEGRIAVVAADGTSTVHRRGLLSADGEVAVVVDVVGGSTIVRWVATATREVTATVELVGVLDPVAATPDAAVVGFVDDAGQPADGAIASARTNTDVVVAARQGEVFRRRLDGNIVPEAFATWSAPGSTTPAAAYVIDNQPAEHPTHYRVRVLDLVTGELGLPFNLRDKAQSVDQLMAGISRTSVVATDSDLLFTLYRGHHDEGVGNYAFIHTLAFGNGVWCLTVPDEMELDDRGGALAVSSGGDRLIAVSANGTIAQIAVDSILDVESNPTFGHVRSLGAETDGAPAVFSAPDALHVGLGASLIEVDPLDLHVRSSLELPVEIEAVAAGTRGVVVAGNGRVLVVDALGAVVAESVVPGGLAGVARIVAA